MELKNNIIKLLTKNNPLIAKVKTIIAFCLSILTLVTVGFYSYKSTYSYKNSSEWVAHTQQVMSKAYAILSGIQNIESVQRGYVITGQESYLDSYRASFDIISTRYVQLKDLVKDNPGQTDLLDSINNNIQLRIKFAKKAIAVRRTGGFQASHSLVTTGEGEYRMRHIRTLITTFISNEESLLTERLEKARQNYAHAILLLFASIVLSIAIVLTTLYFFIKDFNIRMLSEKKAKDSELLLKKFLNKIPVGIFIIDEKKAMYIANDKCAEILGKSAADSKTLYGMMEKISLFVAGTNEVYPPEKLPSELVLNGAENILASDIEIMQHGKRMPLRVNAGSIKNADGKVEYAIVVLNDITDVKDAEAKLIATKKMAEQSSFLKEAFLANMSHEIRTPMNAIIGFTDLLLKRNLEPTEEDYVKTIKTSGESLLRIISDILDISKIESGMMSFEEYPLSIGEIFVSLNNMLSHKASDKNLSLVFECNKNVPEILLGDPTRLTQIIINLVSNAIKFTEKGSITMSAKMLKEENETYLVEFAVKDTGIGIPGDKIPYIFERFRQAESHTTRTYGGTGLGLSIVKQLVELQNGTMRVKSTVGSGSVFTFILPFKKIKESDKAIKKNNTKLNIEEIQKLDILMVEDNPINIKFMQNLFAENGMQTDVANNGKLAVEQVKKKPYDIVLMDIEMPEMNGYEATNIIRNKLKSDVPIIAMTAHAMSGEKDKCLLAGMNDYLSKPINAEHLFEKMADAIHMRIKKGKNTKQEKKLINLAFLISSMNGKKDLVRETIDLFMVQFPEDLLLIKEAVRNKDYKTIKQSAHRMKSTASLMNISAINLILVEMEDTATQGQNMERIQVLCDSLYLLAEKVTKEMQIERLNFV